MKLSGVLTKSGHTYQFRVYTKDGGFTDYDLIADDISITIDDSSVTTKKGLDESDYIDYTDEILGGT